jgi:hypothetical protein
VCTSTLLKILHDNPNRKLSWIDLLHEMRAVLNQVPQLVP